MKRIQITPKSILSYLCLLLATVALNYALPRNEPLSFGLYYASLSCGFSPILCALFYVGASLISLSLWASISAGIQGAIFTLYFLILGRLRRPPKQEKILLALLAQLPFCFLFPHAGYALPLDPLVQKTFLSLLCFLFALLLEDGLHALLFRAFRAKLPARNLAELCLSWALMGLGIARAFSIDLLLALALFSLLASVLLLKNSSALAFACALSLPLVLAKSSLIPCALLTLYAGVALLFVRYGKFPPALALFACFLCNEYLSNAFLLPPLALSLRLLAGTLPVVLLLCIPEKAMKRMRENLLFYRERTLPRVAVNRNRRAVGEQLYEVSALFREIAHAFSQEKEQPLLPRLRAQLTEELCKTCLSCGRCAEAGVFEQLEKLIAVGCNKGRVSLVDLPESVTGKCCNTSGLIFALNRRMDDYRRLVQEMENARAGRALLAEQALGVSEILKNIALEQSEEFEFSNDGSLLVDALAVNGVLCSESFIYGDGRSFTVNLTLPDDVPASLLCKVVSEQMNVPMTLADKVPISKNTACFILRRKANYDAAFGVAFCKKEGSEASGDTHSILKIDERRFLVALSDGMGSGENARTVSDNTLNLIESFYKAKMPSEIVLDTVNRLLAFTSEETFSCLDLAAVDLDTGIADLVKIGAPLSFILSGEKLRVLEGDSLPMGMLEHIRPTTLRAQLNADDFLLFMSDGITSAFPSAEELYTYLSELRPLNPQALAERLLAEALRRYGGRAEDDMTVVAVRLLDLTA